MKILLWSISSFCLLAHVLGDCRRDCLSCYRHLYSHQDDFSLLVSSPRQLVDWRIGDALASDICVMECEGKLVSSATWALCSKAMRKASRPLGLDSVEEEAYQPLETWDSGLLRRRVKHLGDLTRMVDLSKTDDEKHVPKVSNLLRHPEAEDGASDGSQAPLGDFQQQLEIPKGLGGFLSGPFPYGQVEEPVVQELQKRFGGFIGVRKSARKWHNQKRFSEFLKQYLGMSPRSVEYDGFGDELKEQNEI